jgi:hypothetical protein
MSTYNTHVHVFYVIITWLEDHKWIYIHYWWGLQFHGGLVNTATTEVEWFKEFLMDLSMVIKTHMMLSYSGNTIYMIEDPVK